MVKDLQDYANMLFVTEKIPQVAHHRRSAAVAADMCSYSAVKTSPYMAQSFYARSDFPIPSWNNPTSIALPITNVDHNKWELYLNHFNMMSQEKDKVGTTHQNNCEIIKIDQVSKEVTISFRWHPLSSLFDIDRPKRSACFLESDQDISNQPHTQQQIDDAAFAIVLKKSFPGFKTLNPNIYRGILMPDPGFVYHMTGVKIIYNKISQTAVEGVAARKASPCTKSICVPPKRRQRQQSSSCCPIPKTTDHKRDSDCPREVQQQACSRCTKYGDPFPRTIVHLDHRGKPNDSRAAARRDDDDGLGRAQTDENNRSSSSRASHSPRTSSNPFYTSLDQSSHYDWSSCSGEISQDRGCGVGTTRPPPLSHRSRDSIRSCGSNRSDGNSCSIANRSICDTPRLPSSSPRQASSVVGCDLNRSSCRPSARSPTCPVDGDDGCDDRFPNESIAVAARCCRSDENWDPQVGSYHEFSGENGHRFGDESNFLTSKRQRSSLLSRTRSPRRRPADRRRYHNDSDSSAELSFARLTGHSRSTDPSPVRDPHRSWTPQGSRRRSNSALPPRQRRDDEGCGSHRTNASSDRCGFRSGPREDCRCDDDGELPRYYYLEDESMPRTGFDSVELSSNNGYENSNDSNGIMYNLRDVSMPHCSFEYEE